MKNVIIAVAFLFGMLPLATAQQAYLPISTTSKAAIAAFENSNTGKFAELMKKAMEEDPNFFMGHIINVYYASDETRPALIEKVLALDTKNLTKAERIVREHMVVWKKDPNAKIGDNMKKLIDAYPDTDQAYEWAFLHAGYTDKDMEAAMKYGGKLSKDSPSQGAYNNMLGYYYMDQKDMKKAKASFEKYLAISPDDSNAYDSMGDYYMANEEYAQAVKFYDQATEKGMEGSKEKGAQARAAMQ